MTNAPPDCGPWLAEFQLSQLDLVLDQPPALDPDALTQWLGTAADPLSAPLSGDLTALELTSSGGNSSGTTSDKSFLSKPEEERLAKVREQNRAKQNRFRQRQKERREELAAQCEATAADLERERQLNANMKVSCAALEAIRTQKDMAVQVLKAAADAEESSQGKGQVVVAADSSGSLAEQLWGLPFRERVEVCESIFCRTPACSAQTLQIDNICARPDGFALNLSLKKQLAQQVATHHPELLKAVLSISPEMLLKEWAEMGELAAEVVQLYDEGKINEAELEQRMASAVMYFGILCATLLNHKPDVLHCLMDHTKLPGETQQEEVRRWRQLAIDMQVTPEEFQCLLPVYTSYCERIQQLTADTAAALQSLREVQQRLNEQLLEAGLSAGVQQYLRVFDAAGQLSHQSNAALLITTDFISTAGIYVSPLKKTKMIALSRPLHPDVVSTVREGLKHYNLLPADAA